MFVICINKLTLKIIKKKRYGFVAEPIFYLTPGHDFMAFKTFKLWDTSSTPWKCSYRTVIADNTSVLYFRIQKISEFSLKRS